MKNLYSLRALLALLLALTVAAAQAQTIRRVSATVTGTNIYATFDAAQTAATAGDIVQLEPGSYNFDITLTKKLTVVGPGYFLDRYTAPALQANGTPATVTNISFNAGSTGASVAGITASNCYFCTSGVTLSRCNITSYTYLNTVATLISNLNIRQNYLNYVQDYYSTGATNVLLTNNIIVGVLTLGANDSGDFSHNVVSYQYSTNTLSNFNISDNYFGSQYAYAFNNSTLTNNAFYYSSAPTTNGNINNVVAANVFVLSPGTQYDGWYVLKTGTNALRGAGTNGSDIGAYSGNTPYKAGGVPAVPAIYQFSSSVSGNTLNVNLSTRSNN